MEKVLAGIGTGIIAILTAVIAILKHKTSKLKTELEEEKENNSRKDSIINVLETAQDFINKGKTRQDEIREQGEKYEAEVSNGNIDIVDLLNDFNDGV